jgi:hypothetical protein
MVGVHDTDACTDDPADDEYDCLELASLHNSEPQVNAHAGEDISASFTHEGDMEDAIANDTPQNSKITLEVVIEGLKTTKAKALQH